MLSYLRHLVARFAARRSGRRLPTQPGRGLTLGEHFWYTALVTAVVMLAPIFMRECAC